MPKPQLVSEKDIPQNEQVIIWTVPVGDGSYDVAIAVQDTNLNYIANNSAMMLQIDSVSIGKAINGIIILRYTLDEAQQLEELIHAGKTVEAVLFLRFGSTENANHTTEELAEKQETGGGTVVATCAQMMAAAFSSSFRDGGKLGYVYDRYFKDETPGEFWLNMARHAWWAVNRSRR